MFRAPSFRVLCEWAGNLSSNIDRTSASPSLNGLKRKTGSNRMQRLPQPRHVLLKAVPINDAQALRSHRTRGMGIGTHAAQALGKRSHIARPHHKPIHAIAHQVSLAAHRIAHNDWPRSIHGFVHSQSPGLIDRSKHEHIAQIVKARQLRLIAKAEKAHSPCWSLFRTTLKHLPLLAIAHNQQVRKRALMTGFSQP